MLDEKKIYLSSPHMSEQEYELQYVKDAFEKNWIAPLGENVTAFEEAVKKYTMAPYAVALSAGTAALHLSMILCGVEKGDLVFCQSLTFSATVNPVAYLGAQPIFIDSETDSWNMDPKALRKAFEQFGRPRAVVVVHLYGTPAKMDEIRALCQEYETPLIEDAAEALGSEYHEKKCGSIGDFGVLSFNGNKIITTSGGGMLLTKQEKHAAHALKLATQAREPFPWYQHEEIGYNYRMSNICAGIGRGQMKVLEERVSKKNSIYEYYRSALQNMPIKMSPTLDNTRPNRWLSVALLDEDSEITPMQIIRELSKHNIESRHVWKPMHLQPVFADCPFVTCSGEDISGKLFENGICLPSDTKMDKEEMERITAIIRNM